MSLAVLGLRQVYTALHEDAAAAGREVQIGIVKDLFQFHAYRWYNILDHLLAWVCDQLFNRVRGAVELAKYNFREVSLVNSDASGCFSRF